MTYRKLLARLKVLLVSIAIGIISATPAIAAEKEVTAMKSRTVIILSVTGSGNKTIIRDGSQTEAAKGIRLNEGDTIITGTDARVYLSIDNDGILMLESNSKLSISSGILKKLKVKLIEGHMFYNIAKPQIENSSLEMMVNNITIAVRGTSGYLGVLGSAVEHMQLDGHTFVSGPGIEFTQNPAQFFSVQPQPGLNEADTLAIKNITLRDVPKIVIDQMNSDSTLKERIITSVPSEYKPDGTPVYAGKDADLSAIGTAVPVSFPLTSVVISKTTTGSAGGSSSGYGQNTTECPNCHVSYNTADPDAAEYHSMQLLPCGCNDFGCNASGHTSVTCTCGVTYCSGNEAAAAEHATTTLDCGCTDKKCNSAAHIQSTCSCGVEYCHIDPVASEHHNKECPHCHGTYCPDDTSAAATHEDYTDCPECGDPVYGCESAEAGSIHFTGETICSCGATYHDCSADDHYAVCECESCMTVYCPLDTAAAAVHHAWCDHCETYYCTDYAYEYHNSLIPASCDNASHKATGCVYDRIDVDHQWEDFDCCEYHPENIGTHGTYLCNDWAANNHTMTVYDCGQHGYFACCESPDSTSHILEKTCSCGFKIYICTDQRIKDYHDQGKCATRLTISRPKLALAPIEALPKASSNDVEYEEGSDEGNNDETEEAFLEDCEIINDNK